MALSEMQIERFSRQIILPQIGGTGQQRLLDAAVALGGVCACCVAGGAVWRDRGGTVGAGLSPALASDGGGRSPAPTSQTPGGLHLASIAAGVIGALLATEALKLLIGLSRGHGAAW